MQAHLQNAAAAFDASSVASADSVRKVVSLADMVAAMKADEIASRQAQIAFNTKIEADRAATDFKLAALESSAQDAFAVINQQLADVKATSNVMTARIEAVASSFATAHSAAATLAAAAHAEAATTAAAQKLQMDTVMAMLAKLMPAASTASSSAPEAEAAPPTTTLAIVSAPAEPVANDGDDAGAESPFVSGAVPAARRKADRTTASVLGSTASESTVAAEKRCLSAKSSEVVSPTLAPRDSKLSKVVDALTL